MMVEQVDSTRLEARLREIGLDSPSIHVPSTHFFGEDHSPKAASVMIPVCLQPAPSVLLTRRALHMSKHAGEYSFPGGKIDPGEQAMEAALRECFEEIRLPHERIEVVGYLASVPTLSNYQMEAFVGIFDPDTPLVPSEDEVEKIALTHFEQLCAPGVHRVRMETHGALTVPIHSFELDPVQPIWGATAYLLHELLEFLGFKYQ